MPARTGPSSNGRVRALLHDMAEGMRFIVRHTAVLFVVAAMAAGLFTIGCFGPLVAVFVRESLHQTAGVFGVVSAMVGVGLLVGSLAVRKIATRASHDVMVFGGLAGIGGALLLLSAVPDIAATLAATFSMGFAFAAIMVPAQTLLQRETPHEIYGRISSTVMSVVMFAQLLGLIVSGLASQVLSVRGVFLLSAVLCGLLAAGGRMLLTARAPTAQSQPAT